jgi:hypothetical protein
MRRLVWVALLLVAIAVEACAGPATNNGLSPVGKRVTSTKNGLRFTAEVASTKLTSDTVLSVKLTLTNVSSQTVHWNEFGFGWGTRNGPDREDVGIGWPPWGITGRQDPPLTLRPGQSTSDVLTAAVGTGTSHVIAVYGGGEGDPHGRSPEFVVTAPGRPLLVSEMEAADPGHTVFRYFQLRSMGKFSEARKLWWPGTISLEGDSLGRGPRVIDPLGQRDLSEGAHRQYLGRFAEVAELGQQVDRVEPRTGRSLTQGEKRFVILAKETTASPWQIVEISKVP